MSGYLSGRTSLTTVETADIADDAITLAKLASGTDGNIITYDTSGNPTVVSTGTSGHFLKSQGAGSVPVFAAAGGGKVLQVVSGFEDDYATHSNTNVNSPAEILSVSITPSASSSKVLLIGHLNGGATANFAYCGAILKRDSTIIGSGDTSTRGATIGEAHCVTGPVGDGTYAYARPNPSLPITFLDSPSSTSAIAYKIFGFANLYTSSLQNTTFVQNGSGYDYSTLEEVVATTTLTLYEIGA